MFGGINRRFVNIGFGLEFGFRVWVGWMWIYSVLEIILVVCDKICWIFFLRIGIGFVRIKRLDLNMIVVYILEVINCSINRKCWFLSWF